MKFRENLTDSNHPTPRGRGPGRHQAGAGVRRRQMVTSPTGQQPHQHQSQIIIQLFIHCRSRSETHLAEKNVDRLVVFALPCVEVLCIRYLVLADYDPLSDRELGLRQMDQVRNYPANDNDYNVCNCIGGLAQDRLRWLVVRAAGETALQSGQSYRNSHFMI